MHNKASTKKLLSFASYPQPTTCVNVIHITTYVKCIAKHPQKSSCHSHHIHNILCECEKFNKIYPQNNKDVSYPQYM